MCWHAVVCCGFLVLFGFGVCGGFSLFFVVNVFYFFIPVLICTYNKTGKRMSRVEWKTADDVSLVVIHTPSFSSTLICQIIGFVNALVLGENAF